MEEGFSALAEFARVSAHGCQMRAHYRHGNSMFYLLVGSFGPAASGKESIVRT